MILVLILILTTLVTLYYLLSKPFEYWPSKEVKQGKPIVLIGDSWPVVIRSLSIGDMVKKFYNLWPETRYCGIYLFYTPTLVITDPDLVKQISIKDFDYFTDRRSFIPLDDPIWEKNLFSLKGQKWREMRATLSPSFTSSKMRLMFVLMAESAEKFVNYFTKQDEKIIEVNMKDVFSRFTNDVIASAAFGIEVDSLVKKDNEFYVMGKEITKLTGFEKTVKFFLNFLAPKIYMLLNLKFISSKAVSFFVNLITETIKTREEKHIVRPDMINLLIGAKKGNDKVEEKGEILDAGFATVQESEIGQVKVKKQFDDLDIAAQCMIFFFAGFETVSSLMCFMSHELAVNVDMQNRLRDEINDTFKDCGGTLNYETLLKMKYLDMVISETLRKWPNALVLERVCTKPYTIEPINETETPVHLNVGDLIWLPTFAFHRDPEYFPDPERFDPERFSDENKGNINPYTYTPFGIGPRNCIGSRFALLEAKALTFHVLRNFEIEPVEKSVIPLKMSKKAINLDVEGGFWFGFKRINN